jgi:hypothetical protein
MKAFVTRAALSNIATAANKPTVPIAKNLKDVAIAMQQSAMIAARQVLVGYVGRVSDSLAMNATLPSATVAARLIAISATSAVDAILMRTNWALFAMSAHPKRCFRTDSEYWH